MENEIFDFYLKISSFIPEIFSEDIIVGVTNRTHFIEFIKNDQIPLKINIGDPVPETDIIYEAMRKGKKVVAVVPKEAYGLPFSAIAMPIKDKNDKVIGGFGIGRSLAKQAEVSELAHNLSSSLQQITSAINEISSGVQNVASSNTKVISNIYETQEETKKSDNIIKFVNSVAGQTNMLGLNAAIEAARAGEHGRGFSVVAEEIRKLSATTSSSMNEINKILKSIEYSVNHIHENMQASDMIFQEQAAALEQITASMQELYANAEVLQGIASKYSY